jgi:hypothetical protein
LFFVFVYRVSLNHPAFVPVVPVVVVVVVVVVSIVVYI